MKRNPWNRTFVGLIVVTMLLAACGPAATTAPPTAAAGPILWWWNHFDILLIVGTSGAEFGINSSTLPILGWVEAFRWSHLARGAAISVMAMVGVAGVMAWNARRELRAAA